MCLQLVYPKCMGNNPPVGGRTGKNLTQRISTYSRHERGGGGGGGDGGIGGIAVAGGGGQEMREKC